jgi:hypothetical protein
MKVPYVLVAHTHQGIVGCTSITSCIAAPVFWSTKERSIGSNDFVDVPDDDLGWWITSPEMDCHELRMKWHVLQVRKRNYELILMLKNEVDCPG